MDNLIKDIETRSDIEYLIHQFYIKVKQDATIGFFFTEIVHLDFDIHLPKMYDFWESIIFKKASYNGNPMLSHILLNKKFSIEKKHFQKWLFLWEETITENFTGINAKEGIQRAHQIAELIQFKIQKKY